MQQISKMRNRVTYFFALLILIGSVPAFSQEPNCESEDCQMQQTTGTSLDQDQRGYGTSNPRGENAQEEDQLNQLNQIPDVQNAINRTKAGAVTGERRTQNQDQTPCPGPNCPKLPPEEKTEFQKFIYTTTGERLSLYGHNLFSTLPRTFVAVQNGPVPADYIVGPDDELVIRASGQMDFSARVVVDRNGQIFLPRVGTITVAGVRYDQLTNTVRDAMSRVFKNFELQVTLGKLRSIQVIVVGQARRPGTYTVSSLSTVMTVLFAAGGAGANGSLRHIQLRRQNRLIDEFDVYDLLTKGNKSRDAAVQSGDVIFIPPVTKQVAVIGSVNLPGIFEIDEKTSIREQIDNAGGLSTTADGTRVMIERIDGRTSRSVEELKLDDSNESRLLQDGDIVRVFPISPKVDHSVILRGSVAVPGRYPWHEGMRVSDLIPSKDVLLTREYWMRQSALSRTELGWRTPPKKSTGKSTEDKSKSSDTEDSDDTEQISLDDLEPSSKDQMTEKERKRRELLRQQQQDRRWSDGRILDEKTNIVRNPAEINWDYAVVQRLNQLDLSSELMTFDLGDAIKSPGSNADVVLQAGDVITVFSQKDIAVPAEKRTKFVWIEGEVKAPGVYRVQSGDTLRDVVGRAGGLTPSAYLFASEFRRISTKEEQQKEMDQLIRSAERDLRARARLVTNSLNAEDKVAGQQELQYEQAAIDKLRTLQVTGRIVLDLKPIDTQVGDLPAIALEDGDTLLIPAKPATIGVVGSVYNPNSFLYQSHNTVATYLSFAGGGTRDSDGGRLFVVRANGSVVSKQMHRSMWAGSFDNTKLFPGDAIVMPEKIRTTNVLRGLRDWSQVFAQLALGVAALKTISP